MAEVYREVERLKWEMEHGHANEKIHVTWVERDQAERIKNNRRITRFSLETKDPDACSELHAEWDRIVRHVGNKSVALSLIVRAWRDSLSDGELDKILAQLEVGQ